MKMAARIALVAAILFAGTGCSLMRALDFGGSDEKAFEIRWGWEKGIEKSKAAPGEVDNDGVYQPEAPEVDAILGFPDVHAGLMAELQPDPRMTPTVAGELCEFKVPHARWFSVQVGAGNQLVYGYIGKRLVSVFEITVGPWFGWDFEEHASAWGFGGTLIRF